jgi:hypothetical protein
VTFADAAEPFERAAFSRDHDENPLQSEPRQGATLFELRAAHQQVADMSQELPSETVGGR